MNNKISIGIKTLLVGITFGLAPKIVNADLVGIFYDKAVPQDSFAAADVKSALISKGSTVEILPLSSLTATYANKKVVIALQSNAAVVSMLTSQGGTAPKALGEQAYALRTTSTPQPSYWVFGGDANGSMYGGIQIANNLSFSQFSVAYNSEESPSILRRGIKLNLPWDKNSGTYGKDDKSTFDGTSSQLAIKDVWDMTFWTTWFDEMARNRFNTVSLWSCHPFTSLVSVPGYENAAIQNVTYFDGTVKTMSIAEKIVFWKKVMAYAHARGFEFLFFNWNIFTDGATGKYGITSGAANATTKDYMYKSMLQLLNTYPDLDGFGVTNGEAGSTVPFLWATYGKAMHDFAIANPNRHLRFIHRFHFTTFAEIKSNFGPLLNDTNVSFDVSYKWSQAHMYSVPVPTWFSSSTKAEVLSNDMKTWLTVRNDDMYYLNWGDPDFARTYVNGMLSLGTIYRGFYMGSDGYNPTRTFFSKNSVTQGILEVQRTQYMNMLWGRLSYNPNTPDDVFKNYLAVKYPAVSSTELFNAWRNASKGVPLITELVQGSWTLDFHWYPETGIAGRSNGFRTIDDMAGANTASGSTLCSIGNSASNSCGTKQTAYQTADFMEKSSKDALGVVSGMSAAANTDLGVTLNNIKALAYLGNFYAEKIRGATNKKSGKASVAKDDMGRAYCNWMSYSNIMDGMFTGMKNQRVDDLADWHAVDNLVLGEWKALGGTGTPTCPTTTGIASRKVGDKSLMEVRSLTKDAIFFVVPSNATYIVKVFNLSGIKVAEVNGKGVAKGVSKVLLNTQLTKGIFIVKLYLNNASSIKRVHVMN